MDTAHEMIDALAWRTLQLKWNEVWSPTQLPKLQMRKRWVFIRIFGTLHSQHEWMPTGIKRTFRRPGEKRHTATQYKKRTTTRHNIRPGITGPHKILRYNELSDGKGQGRICGTHKIQLSNQTLHTAQFHQDYTHDVTPRTKAQPGHIWDKNRNHQDKHLIMTRRINVFNFRALKNRCTIARCGLSHRPYISKKPARMD